MNPKAIANDQKIKSPQELNKQLCVRYFALNDSAVEIAEKYDMNLDRTRGLFGVPQKTCVIGECRGEALKQTMVL